jgi:hypothetical protein
MSQTFMILLWLLIFFVILLSTPLICNKKTENFQTYYGYFKKYCGNCSIRDRVSCSSCTNCGTCITSNGSSECTPGDDNGPYFRKDCLYWEYGDPYYYYPYSNIFPIIKTKNVYPYFTYGTRKLNK